MKKYQVLVTGSAFLEGEGNNPQEAREQVMKRLTNVRFGIWDMDLEFVCDEEDLLRNEDD
jgi:hypothetical protein